MGEDKTTRFAREAPFPQPWAHHPYFPEVPTVRNLGLSANVSHFPYPPPSSRFPLSGGGFQAFLGLEGMRPGIPDSENPVLTSAHLLSLCPEKPWGLRILLFSPSEPVM